MRCKYSVVNGICEYNGRFCPFYDSIEQNANVDEIYNKAKLMCSILIAEGEEKWIN